MAAWAGPAEAAVPDSPGRRRRHRLRRPLGDLDGRRRQRDRFGLHHHHRRQSDGRLDPRPHAGDRSAVRLRPLARFACVLPRRGARPPRAGAARPSRSGRGQPPCQHRRQRRPRPDRARHGCRDVTIDASQLASAAVEGFLLGAGLIVAIGAQNAFVLRQGLLRRHVFAVATVCAVSDMVLIALGVAGLGSLVRAAPTVLVAVTLAGA
ncbi:MAG: LysE family transporter, partial [Bauldia sp.]|nr:LysE family transporter [Bauldia sp.]